MLGPRVTPLHSLCWAFSTNKFPCFSFREILTWLRGPLSSLWLVFWNPSWWCWSSWAYPSALFFYSFLGNLSGLIASSPLLCFFLLRLVLVQCWISISIQFQFQISLTLLPYCLFLDSENLILGRSVQVLHVTFLIFKSSFLFWLSLSFLKLTYEWL